MPSAPPPSASRLPTGRHRGHFAAATQVLVSTVPICRHCPPMLCHGLSPQPLDGGALLTSIYLRLVDGDARGLNRGRYHPSPNLTDNYYNKSAESLPRFISKLRLDLGSR